MSVSNTYGTGHYTSLSSSTATTLGLAGLRQAGFPRVIDPPYFGTPAQADWLRPVQDFINRYAFVAGLIAALVILVAAAMPAWAALQPESTVSPLRAVRSSAGVTGTPGTRVANLSAETFLGGIPFAHQSHLLATAAGTTSAPQRFVVGAREASVRDYVQNVGARMALPYLNDAASTKESVAAWNAALSQPQPVAAYIAPFQASTPAPGTVIPGARATFYSCIGNGFCGIMANGQQVVEGAAACSYDLPFGTRFFLNADPTKRVFTCLDRGALSATWVDIWFYDAADGWAWQSMIGSTYSAITIVQ